jgi:hypothetical protein
MKSQQAIKILVQLLDYGALIATGKISLLIC